MLHVKYQDNRAFGSGEGSFFNVLPYMDKAAILVM